MKHTRAKMCPRCKVTVIPFRGRCPTCFNYVENKQHAIGSRDEQGHYFPSKGEAARARALKLKETAGQIQNLKLHPSVDIIPGVGWKLDTGYMENGVQVYEDFKGVMSREVGLKIKLWEYFGPAVLRIVKMDYRTGLFRVDQEIRPVGLTQFIEDYKACRAA